MPASTFRLLLLPTLYCGALLAACPAMAAPPGPASPAPASCTGLLRQDFLRLQDEKPQSLCQYSGKVVVVVNTASFCGFTPQYQGLEALYAKYKDKGLVVLGFPSNDFSQETGSNKEIADFLREHLRGEIPHVHQNQRDRQRRQSTFQATGCQNRHHAALEFLQIRDRAGRRQRHQLQLHGRPGQPRLRPGDRKTACSPITPRRGTAFSLTKIYLSPSPLRELPGIGALILTQAQFAVTSSAGVKQFHCCEAFWAVQVQLQSRGAPPPPSLPRSRRGASQHFYIPAGKAPPTAARFAHSGLQFRHCRTGCGIHISWIASSSRAHDGRLDGLCPSGRGATPRKVMLQPGGIVSAKLGRCSSLSCSLVRLG
jgi:glutathione peroxidase-family protein